MLEFGVNYGEEGYVWFGNDCDLIVVIGGCGGFLMCFGDGFSELFWMVDVYIFLIVNVVEVGDV